MGHLTDLVTPNFQPWKPCRANLTAGPRNGCESSNFSGSCIHNTWVSLKRMSGPFLCLFVLLRPQWLADACAQRGGPPPSSVYWVKCSPLPETPSDTRRNNFTSSLGLPGHPEMFCCRCAETVLSRLLGPLSPEHFCIAFLLLVPNMVTDKKTGVERRWFNLWGNSVTFAIS